MANQTGTCHDRPKMTQLIMIGLLLILTLLAACAAEPHRSADGVSGDVRDANTDEPISAAWIFETQRSPSLASDRPNISSARMTQSDGQGKFHFDPQPQGLSLGRKYSPSYAFYHPSYGFIRARTNESGQVLTLRPTLRDAHLRQAAATAFCNSSAEDEMSRKIRGLACPASRSLNFGNGSPRASGSVDNRGRRNGPWVFFREDRSVISRGEYRDGGAIGEWTFEAPR